MSAEENKGIVRRVYEVFSSGNLDDLDHLLTADIVDHNPVPGQPPGLAGVKQVMREFRATFPDLQITAEDMLAEGDKVAARITQRGTHHGAFMGMPPTGKQVTVSGMDIVRLVDGKSRSAGATGMTWPCCSNSASCRRQGRPRSRLGPKSLGHGQLQATLGNRAPQSGEQHHDISTSTAVGGSKGSL